MHRHFAEPVVQEEESERVDEPVRRERARDIAEADALRQMLELGGFGARRRNDECVALGEHVQTSLQQVAGEHVVRSPECV
jgi:hypothetical protein